MPTFEEYCAKAESIAVEIEKQARQLQRSAVAMKKAAQEGDPAKIRKAAGQIDEAASETQQIQDTLQRGWPISDAKLTEVLKGPYVKELMGTAAAAGISLNQGDNYLAAFPVILEILPEARVLKLDKARLTALRPSTVVARIRARLSKAHSKPERFIEILFKAYRLVVGEDLEHGTTLVALYEALTVLPDARSAYSKPEFIRDVYELDASKVRQTKRGATMSLAAATGTRSSDTLSIIPPNGMPKHYYGIRFEREP